MGFAAFAAASGNAHLFAVKAPCWKESTYKLAQ